MHFNAMDENNLARFRAAMSDIGSRHPPVPVNLLRDVSDLDIALVHEEEPDLLLDFILRVTADSIMASHDFSGPCRDEYHQVFKLLSCALDGIATKEPYESDFRIYLAKFKASVAEFDE